MENKEEQFQVALRPFSDISDTNFIFNSYLKSFRGALINKKVSNSIYYKAHQKFLVDYIQSPGSTLILAVNPTDDQQIYGYLLYNLQKNEIYFAYCKEFCRRLGVFKTLLDASKIDLKKPVFYRHDTYAGSCVTIAMPTINWVYKPFYVSDDVIID